jgi:hypothetical protein
VSRSDSSSDDRLLGLLADRATEGLDDAQTAALQALLAAHAEMDAAAFERAAAQVAWATMQEHEEPLPTSLRERLLSDARAYFSRGCAPEG